MMNAHAVLERRFPQAVIVVACYIAVLAILLYPVAAALGWPS